MGETPAGRRCIATPCSLFPVPFGIYQPKDRRKFPNPTPINVATA
ncbi:hypothetical protein [Moorena sp. SIO4G3]|nr:hypothetical protein [Moorena sp. SIO4G3]